VERANSGVNQEVEKSEQEQRDEKAEGETGIHGKASTRIVGGDH